MPQPAIQEYISQVQRIYKEGRGTEHSYRPALKQLIDTLVQGIQATNEPKRIDCGAPDYILTNKKDIPVGYIEAKDIGKNLDEVDKSEQLNRYKESLDNLILTDYLGFRWYVRGEQVTEVSIAHIEGGKVKPDTNNWERFENVIKDFCAHQGQTITSAETLAKMMAAKARMMHYVLENALIQDEADTLNPDTALQEQYKAFKNILLHDISKSEFSDIYAQTIAYGMFAARLHDTTPEDFTREKAAKLVPTSNPFLRKLFQFIAGYDLDTRLSWIVDTLAEVFRATNINAILKNFGKSTQQNDPVIHFYETFLKEYNPALRKSRGVWYTPEPVVNFIVRAVDDILKSEFGLADGLADTTKVTVEVETQTLNKKEKKEFHKVQILDPATGTGTFLAEVVRRIYKKFEGQQGIWSNYVDEHIIPRINGFEILMASYAMAHLKLEILLNETGHKPKREQRLRVFLTNSLEEAHPDTGTLFAQWLSTEANEANRVKRDTPVMVVLGNPPYSVSSSNASINKDGDKTWIGALIDDYKKELNEKKLNLDDDYIKFIRFGEHFIEKNGEGILAYISNNSFLDGVTHRQMRKHLLETFNKVYILNLHGNSNIKEASPDKSKDENVFDIMQGVSINLFVKTNRKKRNTLGEVKYFDLYGLRDYKYRTLFESNLNNVEWSNLDYQVPYYFFVPKNFDVAEKYNSYFSTKDIFNESGSGIKTERDFITIHFNKEELLKVINDFRNLGVEEIRSKYNLKDSRDWKVEKAKDDLKKKNNDRYFQEITYRPFDNRLTYFTGTSKGFIGTPGTKTASQLINRANFAIQLKRQTKQDFSYCFIVNKPCESCTFESAYANNISFPLYIYPDNSSQQTIHNEQDRKPNFNEKIVGQIGLGLKLNFLPEKTDKNDTFAPIDLLDYIYAVLHSPTYREKYKEFLKIDFPRVPYPADTKKFWQLVKLGGELRQIHLLESPVVSKFITSYPIAGENIVSKVKYESGKVWINETQYFDKVPPVAWEFFIGGYQPAQKWLKDRKGRLLSYDDITHYQKIIVALNETARIMKEIDKVGIE